MISSSDLPEIYSSIPIRTELGSADTYSSVPVDTHHPLHLEDLVSLSSLSIASKSYYNISDGTNPPYNKRITGSLPDVKVRKSIAGKLVAVNKNLAQHGFELFVWDGFRPIETQKGIWDFFEHRIRAEFQHLSTEQVIQRVVRYVSNPNWFEQSNPTTWPTHITGAAVDLTIRKLSDRVELDMGAHFDEMSEVVASDFYERQLISGNIKRDDVRLLGRRLLHGVMLEAGFENYPEEFWHFDWGNQMYQFHRAKRLDKQPEPAIFGVAKA